MPNEKLGVVGGTPKVVGVGASPAKVTPNFSSGTLLVFIGNATKPALRPNVNGSLDSGAGEPNMGWDDDGKDAIPKLKAAEELPAGAANEKPEGAEAPLEGTAVPLEGFFTSIPPLGAVQH